MLYLARDIEDDHYWVVEEFEGTLVDVGWRIEHEHGGYRISHADDAATSARVASYGLFPTPDAAVELLQLLLSAEECEGDRSQGRESAHRYYCGVEGHRHPINNTHCPKKRNPFRGEVGQGQVRDARVELIPSTRISVVVRECVRGGDARSRSVPEDRGGLVDGKRTLPWR
ncbi:hypothetical protein [Herbiconiux sp. A18JL235]|uniref:Uncharacterized protein n=1 Tax=Herbiconiux sp. A18JL235 TaxID=3152363 RepID=A0AB39BEJ2_9MICO